MVKYNRVPLARKKELQKPDTVIQHLRKVFEYIVRHGVKVAASFGILLTAIIVFAAIRYFSAAAESKAYTLLEQGMKNYHALSDEKGAVEASRDAAGKLESIIDEYPGTTAARFAEFNLANIYYAAEKYNKAITLYEKAAVYFEQHSLFRNLSYAGLGRCYEAKGNKLKAAEYFEMIAKDDKAILADEALAHLGRIYAELGKQHKSRDAYHKIISGHGDSIYAAIARENGAG
jgi:tetratricopeptide (TPR) repeat protein